MRLIEILEQKQYKTDKWTDHHYVQEIYEPLFSQYREREINFCEIGVWNGESMKLWSDYFVNADNIVGVDIFTRASQKEVEKNLEGFDVKLHKFNSHKDIDKFTKFSKKYTKGFDIVIDDGSHWFDNQINTYKNFSKMMNQGGVYIIEDISFIPESFLEMIKLDGKNATTFKVSKLQHEIPNIEFYMTGGDIHANPIGVIRF
tara:strand:+ start:54 stop:659 length:606 start_codon:yes stop_codon:yes gene_type:complete